MSRSLREIQNLQALDAPVVHDLYNDSRCSSGSKGSDTVPQYASINSLSIKEQVVA